MSEKQELEARLGAWPEVRFALLFGSRATGHARPDSDWNVAVYLDEKLDARARFQTRLGLSAALDDLGEVDVVVLNDTDALLGQRALQGELIDVKDRKGLRALLRAHDGAGRGSTLLRRHPHACAHPASPGGLLWSTLRSSSDASRSSRRCSRICDRWPRRHARGTSTIARCRSKPSAGSTSQRSACWISRTTCIAERGWRASSSYRDAIRVLAEQGVMDEPLTSQIEQWAGLRNVLVHLYLDVDHDVIFGILQTDLDPLQRFAEAVSRAALTGQE